MRQSKINIDDENSINIFSKYSPTPRLNCVWTDEADLAFISNIDKLNIIPLLEKSFKQGLFSDKDYDIEVNIILDDEEITSMLEFILTHEDGCGDIFYNLSDEAKSNIIYLVN